MMPFKPNCAAAILAGLMALTLTACGSADNLTADRASKNAGVTAINGRLYRYPATGDNKGNVKQDVTKAAEDTGKRAKDAADDLARDVEDAARDAADSVTRDAENRK